MAEIDFADGFDVSEPFAWGLTPVQMGAAIVGLLLAYLDLCSPLPRLAALALAPLLAGAGLALGLGRHEGRPLIAWLGVAARFWAGPRSGVLVLTGGLGGEERAEADSRTEGLPREGGRGPGSVLPPDAMIAVPSQVETARRVPLVLLPEPAGEHPVVLQERWATDGGRDSGGLRFADAALLEVPPAREWRGIYLAPPPAVRSARRITFFSLSGGSGRTTLAVEVAGLLAGSSRGRVGRGNWPLRVALVDLDLMNARAGIRLGVPLPVDWDLLDADPADAALERQRVVHGCGLDVFAGPSRPVASGWEDQASLAARLAALMSGLERRGYDVIVVDLPAGLGHVSRWALESADDTFVVLTPTAGGVHDAYRSTAALRALGVRRGVRYVVNRSRGESVMAGAMLDLGGVVAAEIPDDPALERAETEHRLVGLNGAGAASAALHTLAGTVDPELAAVHDADRLHRSRRLRWRRAG
jgi:MinD-like ATPase involved in chromosome partitioning or flagellar assembly